MNFQSQINNVKSSLSKSLDHDFLLEALQKITHRVEIVADKIN